MLKKNLLLSVICCSLILLLGGCDLLGFENKEDKDWTEKGFLTVSPEFAVCRSWAIEGTFNCMSVKEDNEDYWTTFTLKEIKGFDYEVGYEYRLEVLKTHLANPPMDGGSVTYELLKIVSKLKVEN